MNRKFILGDLMGICGKFSGWLFVCVKERFYNVYFWITDGEKLDEKFLVMAEKAREMDCEVAFGLAMNVENYKWTHFSKKGRFIRNVGLDVKYSDDFAPCSAENADTVLVWVESDFQFNSEDLDEKQI